MTEIERIHNQLQNAFYRDSWIGPTVVTVLDGVTAQGAAMRPVDKAHSIWEITNHISFWENLVSRLLQKEPVDTQKESRLDWQPISDRTEEAWHSSLVTLRQGHEHLAAIVASLDDSILEEKSAEIGASFTVYELLHGIVQHDIYHAGQIGLLKKTAVFPAKKGPLLNATSIKPKE